MKAKTKKVKGYTVKEITVQDLLELYSRDDGPELLGRAVLGDLAARARLMAQVCGWDEKELAEMGANTFVELDQAFRELNGPFFEALLPALRELVKLTAQETAAESSSGR